MPTPSRSGTRGLIFISVLAVLMVLAPGVQVVFADPLEDWLTYHHDFARSGHDTQTPAATAFSLDWAAGDADGAIFAQPLVIGDRVLVATEANSVYLLNAVNGSLIWATNLGSPVPASQLPCGDVDPVGTTGTPVADPAAGVVYVASFLDQPMRHELAAVRLADGGINWRRAIDPPGSTPAVQNQRGALALSRGRVYVPFGARNGDCGDFYGRIVGARVDGAGSLIDYKAPTARGAGIWAPSGIAVDAAGALYATTGNGSSTNPLDFDFSNSVIKLSPEPLIDVLSFFAPTNWTELNIADADLGSLGPTLVSDGLAFQIGKEGVGYLLRTANLGEVGNPAFADRVCSSEFNAAFGAVAYAAPMLYVPCREGMVGLAVDTAGPGFSVVFRTALPRPGAPVVSGGIVWLVDRDGVFHGLHPTDGTELLSLPVGPPVTHFPGLSSSRSRLVVPAGDGVVTFTLSAPPLAARSSAAPIACPTSPLAPFDARTARPSARRRSVGPGRAVPALTVFTPSGVTMPLGQPCKPR